MDIAKYIDHTILKADARRSEIEQLCAEAREYGFASVCINPAFVSLASDLLRDSPVKVCTVIGFPLGATTTAQKVFEAETAVREGALEVDMVINIGRLKDGETAYVSREIKEVVNIVRKINTQAIVKVIIECALLTEQEKVSACKAVEQGGAHFIKTSTGFSSSGAAVEDVKLMKRTIGGTTFIKAAGGIRDYETAMAMIEAGADRIGASAGIAIVKASR